MLRRSAIVSCCTVTAARVPYSETRCLDHDNGALSDNLSPLGSFYSSCLVPLHMKNKIYRRVMFVTLSAYINFPRIIELNDSNTEINQEAVTSQVINASSDLLLASVLPNGGNV